MLLRDFTGGRICRWQIITKCWLVFEVWCQKIIFGTSDDSVWVYKHIVKHNYQYSKTFVPPATLIYALVLLPAKSEPFALIGLQEMCVTHRANQKQWHDICLIVKAAHCDKSMPVTKCSSNKSWNYIDQLSQFQFKRSLQFHKATAGCEEHNNANLIIDS